MKIGVNLFPLRPRIAGGHEFYVRNLLQEMLRLDAGHFYYIFTAPWNHDEMDFGKGPYTEIVIEERPSKIDAFRRLRALFGREQRDVYQCATKLGLDLWFCPMMDLQPRNIDIPSVVTIPDIQQEYYPQYFSPEELRHRELTMKPSCHLATAVIAVSDHGRNSLVDRYQLDGGKVHRIYEAASPAFTPVAAEAAWLRVAESCNLKRGYLFYPANTWPHKNHELLLMALHLLKKRGMSPKLVLTGAHIASFDALENLSRQFGLQDNVRHLGYVDQDLFPGLYHGAACLVFPSLYEGFGIPLVEAMASGCAVACSDVCSIPEVVGEAALLFDPRKPDSMADALEQMLRDSGLRRQLAEKGLKQAARFNWATAAKETLDLFEKVRGQKAAAKPEGAPPQDVVEGLQADGWAGPGILIRRVELSRWRTLLLEGETSVHCSPLEIRIMAGQQTIEAVRLANPGAFSRKIVLPPPAGGPPLPDIHIAAGRCFVPKKIGLNNDKRRLSYRIHHLALIDAEGHAMALHGR